MKITIDTSQDSHNDIRKAIKMLQSIVGEGLVYSNSPSRNIFDDPSPGLDSSGAPEPAAEQDTGNAFASIFDNSSGASGSEEKKQEEKDEDMPQLEFY
ncbi:hypothetical protein GF343_00535 [Candidatus Woesearchaeota archaeon]|nr:hypothetical protein [Candidatus Woesearchaeota archaeon]